MTARFLFTTLGGFNGKGFTGTMTLKYAYIDTTNKTAVGQISLKDYCNFTYGGQK
jgi:hypothetical protein